MTQVNISKKLIIYKGVFSLINTEDLKRLMNANENLYYGRNYINIHDHSHKFAVIDDAYQVPIIFVHCYNYTEDEAERLSRQFDSFFYHKLPEFHMENKIVLMFIDTAKMVAFLTREEDVDVK